MTSDARTPPSKRTAKEAVTKSRTRSPARAAVAPSPIRVATIFNDRELALNAGSAQGVVAEDVYRILSATPHKIVDPETKEELGEIVHTKAVVRVYEVQERFSLARTFRSRRVNVGGQGGGLTTFSKMFEPPEYEVRVETLRRNPNVGPQQIKPEQLAVAVGDVAEKVTGDVNDLPSMTIWT